MIMSLLASTTNTTKGLNIYLFTCHVIHRLIYFFILTGKETTALDLFLHQLMFKRRVKYVCICVVS